MATKTRKRRPVRRKRKSLRGAKKTWRFIKKHRRRRKRLHPTRRKQENLAILGGVASLPLLFFIGIPAAVFAGVAAGGAAVASKGSPPPTQTRRPRRVKDTGKDDEAFNGWFRGRDALKIKATQTRGHPCDKTCKYSTHDVKTCVCSCGGKQHGIWAWGPSGTTTPRQPKPARRKTTRRRTTTRKRTR